MPLYQYMYINVRGLALFLDGHQTNQLTNRLTNQTIKQPHSQPASENIGGNHHWLAVQQQALWLQSPGGSGDAEVTNLPPHSSMDCYVELVIRGHQPLEATLRLLVSPMGIQEVWRGSDSTFMALWKSYCEGGLCCSSASVSTRGSLMCVSVEVSVHSCTHAVYHG